MFRVEWQVEEQWAEQGCGEKFLLKLCWNSALYYTTLWISCGLQALNIYTNLCILYFFIFSLSFNEVKLCIPAGTTSEEGVIFVYGAFNGSVSVLECIVYTTAIFKQHTLRVLQKYLPVYHKVDKRTMLSQVRLSKSSNCYLDTQTWRNDWSKSLIMSLFLIQIVTDFVFLCPARWSARSAMSMGGAVWMYVFDHAPSDHKIWAGLTFCYNHVCHGAELPFLFDSAPATNFSFTARESHLANQMVCYWGAFAHSGDPNSHREHTHFCRNQRLPRWPKYAPAEGWPVLNLTLQSHLQHGNRDHFCDFWDHLNIYWWRKVTQ